MLSLFDFSPTLYLPSSNIYVLNSSAISSSTFSVIPVSLEYASSKALPDSGVVNLPFTTWNASWYTVPSCAKSDSNTLAEFNVLPYDLPSIRPLTILIGSPGNLPSNHAVSSAMLALTYFSLTLSTSKSCDVGSSVGSPGLDPNLAKMSTGLGAACCADSSSLKSSILTGIWSSVNLDFLETTSCALYAFSMAWSTLVGLVSLVAFTFGVGIVFCSIISRVAVIAGEFFLATLTASLNVKSWSL